MIHVFLQWMLEPDCQSVKQMFICCGTDCLWETAPPFLGGKNGPLRRRDLKLTGPVKHLWLQQLSQHCNRSHTAAKFLLWVIILFTCLVPASGEGWSRTLVKQQTMLSLLCPIFSVEQRWGAPLLRKCPKPSSSSSAVHASNEPSPSSVRRVCVCQQVHSRRISALPATFMEWWFPLQTENVCEEAADCVWCRACVRNVHVCAHARAHIANTAIPFHTCRCLHQRAAALPYATRLVCSTRLLTVERQQLPSGFCVCCSVMKAFLISGLGWSLPGSQLETAEINTCSPAPRSQMMTKPQIQDPLRVSAGSCWHQEVFIPASVTLSGH